MSEKKEAKKAMKAEKKAAKKAAKGRKGDKGFKVFIAIILVIAIIGELYIGVTLSSKLDNITSAPVSSEEGGSGSTDLGIAFKEGTYGGVEFKSVEDVVNYYNEAYNKTKAKTAQYKNDKGEVLTYFDLLGDEDLTIVDGSLQIDGKPANSVIQKMIPTVLGTVFQAGFNGLPPASNRNPEENKDSAGQLMNTSRVVVEDVKACQVEENSDGTIKLSLVPVDTEMSEKGMDSQGHFFNSLGAIDKTVEDIGVKWASGTTAENCKVTYENGTAVVNIDPATGEIVSADYTMLVLVNVTHATAFGVINDRGAALTIQYASHFPASAEYLAERGFTKV